MKYQHDLFVSYSRYDSNEARRLADKLTTLGIDVWFAETEVLIEGRTILVNDQERLLHFLREAIQYARYCVLLVSDESAKSEWVRKEVEAFLEREREEQSELIIPVFLQPGNGRLHKSFSERLANRKWMSIDPIDDLALSIARRAGIPWSPLVRELTDRPSWVSREKVPVFWRDTNDSRRSESFVLELDIGEGWQPAPRRGGGLEGVVFMGRHPRTMTSLNLFVGPLSRDGCLPETADAIEFENEFAEGYLANLPWVSKLLFPRSVFGSHIINVLNRPHFAFSYQFGRGFYRLSCRKYSVVLVPPGGTNFWEFVFTMKCRGHYRQLVARTPIVEAIIGSLGLSSNDAGQTPAPPTTS